jgi:hypothetical protein
MKKATPFLWKAFTFTGSVAFILLSSTWYFLKYYPEIPSTSNILLTILYAFTISLEGLLITLCVFKTIDQNGVFFQEENKIQFLMNCTEDLSGR